MANATGLLPAHPVPQAGIAAVVANYMQTGSAAPTLAAPTFRTGSTNTYTTTSAPATMPIPLSASIVTGDLILMCVKTLTGVLLTSTPPGFQALGNGMAYDGNYYTYIFWRIAQAGDAGSTLNWSHNLTGANIVIATLSYSGVNPNVPAYYATNQNTGGTGWSAPILSTPVASTVLEVFTIYATSPVLTAPTTQRVAANAGSLAVAVAEQTQGSAGSTGTQTATSTAAGNWIAYTIILNGAASGGAAPIGGWTLVDNYCPVNATQTLVYQTPAASNNATITWYLVFQFYLSQSGGSGYFYAFPCEVYTPGSHTYNATTVLTANSNPPFTPGPGTTPPYAQVNPTAPAITTNFPSQWNSYGAPNTGTNNFVIAANKDGFFLAVNSGTQPSLIFYCGTATTLITNPNLTDVLLVNANFMGQPPQASVTREPGWVSSNFYWGNYNYVPFYPAGPSYTTLMGVVNGNTGDLFQSPSMPIAARIMLYRQSVSTPGLVGGIRALLPSWLQWAQQTGCAWGDTVTESSDSLTFVGGGVAGVPTWLWIDTSTA